MLQSVLNELVGPRDGRGDGPGSAVPTRRDAAPGALSHEMSDDLVYTPDEEFARLASHHST